MVEIEILRKGQAVSSNGVEVDLNDELLDQVVESYDPQNFKAPLIVSHNTGGEDDASLAESELAYGFPTRLERRGDRVKAVFEKISPQFVQWNRQGRLLGISPSLYPPTAAANPTPGRWSLRHIAGLGKNPPAIKGLAPLALSELAQQEDWVLSLNEFKQDGEDESVDFSYGMEDNTLTSVANTILALDQQMDPEAAELDDSAESDAVRLILEVARRMTGDDAIEVSQNYDAIVNAAKTVLEVAERVAMPSQAVEVEEPEEDESYEDEGSEPLDYGHGYGYKKPCGCDGGCGCQSCQDMDAIKMLLKIIRGGSGMNFGGGHNKAKKYGDMPSYDYSEPSGDEMSDQERDELELLRAEREALQAEVRAARIESLVSFCEAYQDRFTPAMKASTTVDFGEESIEMDAVDFMASLNGTQLAWFKEMVKTMPVQVEFGEVASDDLDPGSDDDELNFEERLAAARLALQKSFNTAGGLE